MQRVTASTVKHSIKSKQTAGLAYYLFQMGVGHEATAVLVLHLHQAVGPGSAQGLDHLAGAQWDLPTRQQRG